MKKTYVIVGEAWEQEEEIQKKPFVSPSSRFLRALLHDANIDPKDCFFTYVINKRPPNDNFSHFLGPRYVGVPNYPAVEPGQYLLNEHRPELERLKIEIHRANPKVVIALGNVAMWALTKRTGISKYRGPAVPILDTPHKVVCTYQPGAIMRQYSLRPVFLADLQRAKREAEIEGLDIPNREIWIEPSLPDIAEFYERYILPADALSVDIETKNSTITEVGFAPSLTQAIVIPFYTRKGDGNYWQTAESELKAWLWVKKYLEKPCFGQNFQYDVKYLWFKMGIPVPNWIDDTMILHHTLQPEMQKGLGFLASIYTNEPPWKTMRQEHSNRREE